MSCFQPTLLSAGSAYVTLWAWSLLSSCTSCMEHAVWMQKLVLCKPVVVASIYWYCRCTHSGLSSTSCFSPFNLLSLPFSLLSACLPYSFLFSLLSPFSPSLPPPPPPPNLQLFSLAMMFPFQHGLLLHIYLVSDLNQFQLSLSLYGCNTEKSVILHAHALVNDPM